MSPEQMFQICNTLALAACVAVIAAPRWAVVTGTIHWGVITGLLVLYAVLIAAFFFRVEGGGFFTLAAVQTLFTNPHVALAGWVHYLAFDLFVGLWISGRADAMGLNRVVQAPILIATFMFGPFGFLLFQAVRAASVLMPRSQRALI